MFLLTGCIGSAYFGAKGLRSSRKRLALYAPLRGAHSEEHRIRSRTPLRLGMSEGCPTRPHPSLRDTLPVWTGDKVNTRSGTWYTELVNYYQLYRMYEGCTKEVRRKSFGAVRLRSSQRRPAHYASLRGAHSEERRIRSRMPPWLAKEMPMRCLGRGNQGLFILFKSNGTVSPWTKMEKVTTRRQR